MTAAPDVIVVGAGIAGICAWDLLRRTGCSVELLEAGPADAPCRETPATDASWVYAADHLAIDWPRVHGVGGRAHLWGSWLGRFSDDVFARGGWPVSAADMAAAYAEAERWLGSVQHALPACFAPLRDCAGVLTGRQGADERPSPWIAALAEAARAARADTIGLRLLHRDGRVHGLEVRSPRGVEQRFADHIVLAASPIETCRLLLASGAAHPAIGHHLTDHTTTSCCVLGEADGRTARLADAREALLRCAGFTVEIYGPKPLDAATAHSLQRQDITAYPGMPHIAVAALGEQAPRPGQLLQLDPDHRDRLGRPLPRLRLSSNDHDAELLAAMREACTDIASRLAGREIVELRNSRDAPRIFHPGGLVRMGSTSDAPTDPHGRVREWPNVWIADASVFPTSGDSYPTLTVIAHVHRLVHRLSSVAGRS